jgi:hypothetical protein
MHANKLPGRRRTLDRNKKTQLANFIARGATVGEAAAAFGVSIRTVQREARRDPDFDQQLRGAQAATPDPLHIMESAARTHWRAAAWLLERTDPENYGRRAANSCSPFHFEQALLTVLEATLEMTAPDQHAAVYKHVHAACEAAFERAFPTYGPSRRRFAAQLKETPLTDAARLHHIRTDHSRDIPDEVKKEPEALARALTLPQVPTSRVGAMHPPSQPTAHGPLHPKPRNPAQSKPAASTVGPSHRSKDAELADPRLSWQYAFRAALSLNTPDAAFAPGTIPNAVPSLLSPKTPLATNPPPDDKSPAIPPHSAPEPNPVE